MTFVKHRGKIPDVPNQPDPNRPLYGFKYARKSEVEAVVARWGLGRGGLTDVGTFALDEFLAKYGDAQNPPPALLPREDGES